VSAADEVWLYRLDSARTFRLSVEATGIGVVPVRFASMNESGRIIALPATALGADEPELIVVRPEAPAATARLAAGACTALWTDPSRRDVHLACLPAGTDVWPSGESFVDGTGAIWVYLRTANRAPCTPAGPPSWCRRT
jgi:hypothetical protein